MRRVLWLAVLVVVFWSGWWAFAALSLRAGISDWFELRRAEGWQADYAAIRVSGYPFRIDLSLSAPALADPATGVAVEASVLRLTSPAWWPGEADVIFPDDRILLASPEGRSAVLLEDGRAALRLKPGSALELRAVRFGASSWTLEDPAGTVLTAGATEMSMMQDEADPARYTMRLNATGLTPGPGPRQRLQVPQDWPVAFDALGARMQVQFDRPWDRRALEERRPQPQQINLSRAEIRWGELSLMASADLGIDASGMPWGTVPVQARNWRSMLDLAVSAGTLSADFRPQVERALSALAAAGGNPERFEVTLTLEKGQVRVGFLPLGPAPRLILR